MIEEELLLNFLFLAKSGMHGQQYTGKVFGNSRTRHGLNAYSMIVAVTGILKSKDASSAVVDIHGMDIRIFTSATTLTHLPACGKLVTIHTFLYVREDQISLYGFISEEERALFDLLLSVSGIGPKGALRILSVATVDQICMAIGSGEINFLRKISGIGEKTAQKLILELRDKIGTVGKGKIPELLREDEETTEALIALGYKRKEAREAVSAVRDAKGLEERVRRSLQYLGSKNK